MTDLCAAVAADGCGTFDYQRVSQRSAAVDTEVAAVDTEVAAVRH